ncbi:bacteriophage holin [Lactococcus cremoris]|uniref:bacteriophage holin n=1 Tax=Lactococcus lactis subsp. cremoris TaxID=1359 RepID=UPI0028162330|nr:bacteriophage holin [Lactococcus cremoris]MDU3892885.1 bacteriophage holin [Lactococcus lactis]
MFLFQRTFFIKFILSVPLLTGALFLCYNIVGMFVRFHPISRVKLLFGAAFLFVVNLQQYYQKHNDML